MTSPIAGDTMSSIMKDEWVLDVPREWMTKFKGFTTDIGKYIFLVIGKHMSDMFSTCEMYKYNYIPATSWVKIYPVLHEKKLMRELALVIRKGIVYFMYL